VKEEINDNGEGGEGKNNRKENREEIEKN